MHNVAMEQLKKILKSVSRSMGGLFIADFLFQPSLVASEKFSRFLVIDDLSEVFLTACGCEHQTS